MSKKYTIKDIANMAGVSPATVSRVCSDTPGVNTVKRQEIKDLIKKTGYRPSSVARSLVSGRTNVVGLIVRDLENQYYSSMAVAFQKELTKIGYIPMVMSVDAMDDQQNKNYLSEVISLFDFAGLFITVLAKESVLEEALRECTCPVILLNRTFDISCDQVVQNDYRAGAMAAEHLLGLGHRKFLLVGGPFQTSASLRFRMEGFQQALAAAGIGISRENILRCELDMTSAHEAVNRYLEEQEGNLPTAAFAAANNMALGLLQSCSEKGIRIPEDLSVVTADNPPIMSLPGIDLTTVSISVDDMVREAVKMLKARIDGRKTEQDLVVLQPELIVRGSSKKR